MRKDGRGLQILYENVYNFRDFYKALMPQNLWNGIFVEFRDNGPSGCRRVVRVNSRKWGHSRGGSWAAQCALVGLRD